ncbi:hypothetical protein D3C74_242880 [compost metagenome]
MVPEMHDLYNHKTGVTPYRIGSSEIFVNFNRRMEPFIRVNHYSDKTKTFPFTKKGHKQAIQFLRGGERFGT